MVCANVRHAQRRSTEQTCAPFFLQLRTMNRLAREILPAEGGADKSMGMTRWKRMSGKRKFCD
jgi:hypothetical protein